MLILAEAVVVRQVLNRCRFVVILGALSVALAVVLLVSTTSWDWQRPTPDGHRGAFLRRLPPSSLPSKL